MAPFIIEGKMKFVPICLNTLCGWKGWALDFTEDHDFICPHCYQTTVPINTLATLEEDSVSQSSANKAKNYRSDLE